MIRIYTEKEVAFLREGGKRLAQILDAVARLVRPGISTKELDGEAERLISKGGDVPAFLGYTPDGARFPFPATLCASVNDEVVHGIPSERILLEGDIVGLDLGLVHKGLIVDMAVTIPVGKIDARAEKIILVTKEALGEGIKAVRAGAHVSDIGHAIQSFVLPHDYGIISELGGHGVGRNVHEEPFIPNFGKKGKGPLLKSGMVLALEPMFTEKGKEVYLSRDGYTFKTRDGSRSAHFEHTILVTEKGAEILTRA